MKAPRFGRQTTEPTPKLSLFHSSLRESQKETAMEEYGDDISDVGETQSGDFEHVITENKSHHIDGCLQKSCELLATSSAVLIFWVSQHDLP